MVRLNRWISALAIATGLTTAVSAQTGLPDPAFAPNALVAPGAKANPACQAAMRYAQYAAVHRADLIGGLFSDGAIYYGAGDDPLHGRAAITDFYTVLMTRSQPRSTSIGALTPSGPRDCYMELIGALKDYRAGAAGQDSYQPLPGAIDRFTVDAAGKVVRLYIFFRPQTFELLKAAVAPAKP